MHPNQSEVQRLLEHPFVVVARGLPICNAAPAVRGQLPWLIYPRHAALGSATPILVLASPNTANPSTWVRPAARISALRASSALWRRWAPRQLAHSGCTLGGLHERVRVGLRMEVARDDIQQLVL
eukprot:CAMPEP_0181188110 /NCGR_PEP_ID=MMETSP1096-20121128/10934_1 /TAXON_ID=156174 ORGANISM="Chrysochromulina ericina, Strain CCMP281" /NCGR_SAMPLE_ID=MMETSP1096 /ASSEMBLY_ACC=CAM_ASM_000453 /LENGTH=124 /DNA_ID=CAMNT_0023277135 /DNA_START=279 /DNA_END=649 /DNA_ORIENTATION=-